MSSHAAARWNDRQFAFRMTPDADWTMATMVNGTWHFQHGPTFDHTTQFFQRVGPLTTTG